MMDNLQITSDDVQQYGTHLNTIIAEISQLLQVTHQKMMNMSNVWDSPASRSLIEQFNSCRPIFSQYVEALQQYSAYLSQTANAYQDNESALQHGIQ